MTETRPLRAYADIALGRQRSPQHDTGPHMVPYLRAANVKDGYLDLSDVKEMNFSPAEQRIFDLQPGDVLVTEGSGSLSAVGASAVWSGELAGTVCFQNTLLRLRPHGATDPRFLAWWCRFAFADGLFASAATGANIFHLSADRVRGLPMTWVGLEEQRAIADFLDVETARIDALIDKKRRLITLLTERFTAVRSELLGLSDFDPTVGRGRLREGWTDRSLSMCIELQRGHDLPLDDRRRGAVPVVSSGGVSGWHDVAIATGPGVVTGRYGTIGSAYFIGEPYWPLNTTLYVKDFRGNEPRWVYHLLGALPLDSESAKSAVTGINRNVVGLLRVPTPPPSEQQAISGRIDVAEALVSEMSDRLTQQIALLEEKRRALITAAVTGEFAVPGTSAA